LTFCAEGDDAGWMKRQPQSAALATFTLLELEAVGMPH